MVKKANEAKDSSKYHVPNLERALEIMETLAESPEGLSMTDLAQKHGISRNSVFRITNTLQDKGYLLRDEESKKFTLGHKLLSLGYASVNENNLVERSLDLLRRLRDETRETVLLGTLVGHEGVVLEQIAGLHPVKFLVDVGTRFPLHTGAPGKAILAALPDTGRERIISEITLTRYNERTITTRKAFDLELKQTAERGYAIDRAEQIEGVHCIAAVIRDHRRQPLGGVWVTAPTYRLPEKDFSGMGEIVKACALQISRRFGYQP